jgi:dipeptidyl aminopeptidase/acylaminoacyl peptidase
MLWAVCAIAAAAPLTAGSAAEAGALTARELVEIVDIDSLSISPDGRTGVFRTEQADVGRNSYTLRWYAVDLQTGAVRDIGSGGAPIYLDPGSVQPEKVLWINGGRAIVYRASVDGAVGLWRADLGGTGARPLVVRDADVEEYSLRPEDGALLYTVGPSRAEIQRAEQHEYDSGILVDSSVDLSQNLFRGGSINGRAATQRLVGYWYVRDGLLWKAPRQQHALDLETGVDTTLGPPIPVGPFEPPKPRAAVEAKSSAGDLAQANWDGTVGSLTAIMADGTRRSCADPMCAATRISSIVWRPGTRDLLVTFIDRHHRQSLYLWQTKPNAIRKLVSADGLLSGGRRNMFPCAVGHASALCVASNAASPPQLERIDLETGERRSVFDPNGSLRARYTPEVRFIRWAIGDGRDATGVLMRTQEAEPKPAPLYVNYYTCEGFLRGGEGDEWPIPQLLDAGFAVVCINAVPSSGPQDAVEEYRTGLAAVQSLVAKFVAETLVDRSKVAMGGLSFGSEVAMWVATHSHLLGALSIASGQLEPASYWISSMPGSDQPSIIRKVWGIGAPDETWQRWRSISPALNTGRVNVPVLLQLPEQEARRIPELYARLAKKGLPVELYAYPDEAHIKVQPRHRLAVYVRNLDWFRYWLQAFEDPDPAKAEQYRRWGKLRAAWKDHLPRQARD